MDANNVHVRVIAATKPCTKQSHAIKSLKLTSGGKQNTADFAQVALAQFPRSRAVIQWFAAGHIMVVTSNLVVDWNFVGAQPKSMRCVLNKHASRQWVGQVAFGAVTHFTHSQVAAHAGRSVLLVLDFDAFTALPLMCAAPVSKNSLIAIQRTMYSKLSLRVTFDAHGFHEGLASQLCATVMTSQRA